MKWCPKGCQHYNVPFLPDGVPAYTPPRDHPLAKDELKRKSLCKLIVENNKKKASAARNPSVQGLPLPLKDCFICENLLSAIEGVANSIEVGCSSL